MTTNIGTGAVLITGPTSGLGRALTLKLAGKCRMRQVLVQQLGPQGLGERVGQVPVLQLPGVVEHVPGTTPDQERQRP